VHPSHHDYWRAEPHPEEWLLIEWPQDKKEPSKYWLSTLPETTTLIHLVHTTKLRWRIERDYQELIPAGRNGDGSIGRLRRCGGIVLGDAAVPAPLPIRTDHDAAELRRFARRERDGRVSARLLALANALDGLPREVAAKLAGMTGQTLGDWVHRYNVEGVEGLRDRPRRGRPCALDEGRQAALKALVLKGPNLERDGCVAWRARDLCTLVEERFGVRYGESGMLRLLKGLDLSWQKTRPVHPEADPKAQERFKKSCPV
jgi:transposase